MRTRKGGQRRTVPAVTPRWGRDPGVGGSSRNSCRSRPRKTKSSARASPSPRQDRAPQPKGTSARQGAPGTRNLSGGQRGDQGTLAARRGPTLRGSGAPSTQEGPQHPGGDPSTQKGPQHLEGTLAPRKGPTPKGSGDPSTQEGPQHPGGPQVTRQEGLGVVPGVRVLVSSQEVGDQDGASRHRDAPDTGREQGGAGIYWDRLGCTGALLGYTGACWDLLVSAEAYWCSLGSTGLSQGLLGSTGLSWGLLGPIGVYWGPPGTFWDVLRPTGTS